MPNLFSYGTLQKEQVQLETFGRLLQGEKDILSGYKLNMLEITDPEVLRKSGQKYHPILEFSGFNPVIRHIADQVIFTDTIILKKTIIPLGGSFVIT
jgi:hypothetical protein